MAAVSIPTLLLFDIDGTLVWRASVEHGTNGEVFERMGQREYGAAWPAQVEPPGPERLHPVVELVEHGRGRGDGHEEPHEIPRSSG